MTPPRIVFFDAGGTLLRPEPGVGEVYARVGRRHGVDASPGSLERAFRAAFRAKRDESIPQSRDWWRDVVARTFAPFGRVDLDALFVDLYDHFTDPGAWRPEDGAAETIDMLAARGIRTGLLSNWDDRLEALLDGLSLLERLSPRIVSYRIGAEKPDPRIFHAALEAAEVEPADALLIGDDQIADVEGARAVGMRAVLYDPGAERNGVDVVRRLVDLPALL